MKYLIIHPENDYEMFNDGNIETCIKEVERKIISADTPYEAIILYVKGNEGQVRAKSLRNYFCIAVSDNPCYKMSDMDIMKFEAIEEIDEERKQREKDLAELARLQKKLNTRA